MGNLEVVFETLLKLIEFLQNKEDISQHTLSFIKRKQMLNDPFSNLPPYEVAINIIPFLNSFLKLFNVVMRMQGTTGFKFNSPKLVATKLTPKRRRTNSSRFTGK